MFYKIIGAKECIAFDLQRIDVIRLEEDEEFHVYLKMYIAINETPIFTYDVTKLTIDQRLELFNSIVAALNHEVTTYEYKILEQ